MKSYRYVGEDDRLFGCTALGRYEGQVFVVQVDQHNHPWAHDWWITNPENWAPIYEDEPMEAGR